MYIYIPKTFSYYAYVNKQNCMKQADPADVVLPEKQLPNMIELNLPGLIDIKTT